MNEPISVQQALRAVRIVHGIMLGLIHVRLHGGGGYTDSAASSPDSVYADCADLSPSSKR